MAFVDQNPFPCEKNMEFRFSPRYVLRVHPESGSSEGSGHPEGGRSGKLPWKPVIRISFSKHCNTKKKKNLPEQPRQPKKNLAQFWSPRFFFGVFFFQKHTNYRNPNPCPSRIFNHPPATCFTTKPTNHRPSADVEKISSTAGTSTGSTPPPPEVGSWGTPSPGKVATS